MTIFSWISAVSTVFLAFLAERWFSFFFPGFFSMPMLAAFVVSLWLFLVPPAARIALSFIAGFFFDSLSSLPFGTYTLLFLIYAGAGAVAAANIERSRRRFAVLVWGGIVLFTLPFLLVFAGIVVAFFRSVPFHFSVRELEMAGSAAVFWTMLYVLVAGVLFFFSRRLGRVRSHTL